MALNNLIDDNDGFPPSDCIERAFMPYQRFKNYLNDKLIIIEESHVFFQNVISGKAKQAIYLYNKLYEANNPKFLHQFCNLVTELG